MSISPGEAHRMDVNQLTALARTLSKEQFAERHPQLFFLFYEEKSGISPLHFKTELAPRGVNVAPNYDSVLRVIEVVKSASNPYADRISIGRARNCDVVLRDASVSKLHAHIKRDDGGNWLLVDSGSHNGTSINGHVVAPSASARLATGDLVTFGRVTVRVADGAELHLILTRLLHASPT